MASHDVKATTARALADGARARRRKEIQLGPCSTRQRPHGSPRGCQDVRDAKWQGRRSCQHVFTEDRDGALEERRQRACTMFNDLRRQAMPCREHSARRRFHLPSALVVGMVVTWARGCGAQSAPVILEPTPGMLRTDEFENTIQIGEAISFSFAAESQGGKTNQLLPGETNKYDPFVWKLEDDFFPRIAVDEDPGMPNGAYATPSRFDKMDMTVETFLNPVNNLTTSNPIFKYELTWTWIPTCAQTATYKMYMSIFNTMRTLTKQFTIHVLPPNPQFISDVSQTRHARIGCPITLQASARDNSSVVRALGLDGYAMIWDLSVTRMDVRGVQHDVPSLAGSSWQQLPGRNVHNGTDAVLHWTPQRGQEGSTYLICFLMQDACKTAAVQRACTNVTVVKCQRCMHDGHTLQSLAGEYRTDYLALYSMNVAIPNPDRVPMGTLVNTGIKYRVRDGDDLFSIAERFFTSVPHLLSVNPDIAEDSADHELLVGDQLCVLPPVCSVKCEHGTICSLVEKQSNGISSI